MTKYQHSLASSRVSRWWLGLTLLASLFILAACQPAINAAPSAQPAPTANFNVQTQISPIPTIPPYRCGAWTSNNAPNPFATITIYARLTHSLEGVAGKQASATVHFRDGDFTIDQQATSDSGGYVSFTLNLQDRQPVKVPATIDVTFSGLSGGSLNCSQAFFTPM